MNVYETKFWSSTTSIANLTFYYFYNVIITF